MADLARAQARTQATLERTIKENGATLDRMAAERRAEQADTKANLDKLSADLRAQASRSEAEWKEFRRMVGEQANRQGRLVRFRIVEKSSVASALGQCRAISGNGVPG
jgi:hypothetical protein